MAITALGTRLRTAGLKSLTLTLLAALWLTPLSAQINLSDIVAGGNGEGLGWTPEDDLDFGGDKFAAVNLDNGTFMTRAETDQFHGNTVDGDGINPSPSEGAPFLFPDDTEEIEGGRYIDSVFFLPSLDIPLNQEGVTFPYIAGDEWGNSWNHVLSNRTHDIDKGREDIFAGGNANWETGIGIHASAGITFDLDAIREEHGADKVVSFSTFIGADRCGALINFYVIFSDADGIIDDPNGNASFMDGNEEVRYWVEASNPSSAAQYIAEIPEGAVYLTLTVGSGGNGIGCDHGVLANPQILDFVPPSPVEDLTCVRSADSDDWEISWTAQADPPPDPIAIYLDGELQAELPNTASSYTLPSADAEGDFQICVENGAPFPSCCSPAPLDADGQIKHWLVLGPFSNNFGCSGPDPEPLLGNHIAPSKIGCQYPVDGDTIEYDPFEAVSNDYVGPASDDGDPAWRIFDDGGENGLQDLDAEASANGWQSDDVMAWLVTYFTYSGNGPIEPDLCVGSDDGVQVWIDDQLVWTNNACRGGGVCQDVVFGADNDIVIDPGPHRVAVAAWDRGGGWNARFGFQVGGLPVLDSDPDWTFHGTVRPDGLEAAPGCEESECEELELTPAQTTLAVGGEVQLTATCFDASRIPQNVTADVEFSVVPDGIISISDTGLITGLALGEAEVTATLGGLTATSSVGVARILSLADMVAGGDGTGPGWNPDAEFAGINLDTGVFMTRTELDGFNGATVDTDGVNPSPVDASDFVDSVFFLNVADLPITSEGVVVDWSFGDEWGNSWNHVLSNLTHRIDAGDNDITAGGLSDWQTGIGVHASAGISFDLDAIRAEHGAGAAAEFSVSLGKDECDGNISLMIIYSNADGVIPDELAEDLNPPALVPFEYVRVTVTGDELHEYRGEIPEEATHLTLAVGANGDGIGCAHGVFAEPTIIGAAPTEVGVSLLPGDVNYDGQVNISDPVAALGGLFGGAGFPECYTDAGGGLNPAGLAVADWNGDGSHNIADAVASLGSQFGGGDGHVLGGSCVLLESPCADICQ